jgi:hypothetical protein
MIEQLLSFLYDTENLIEKYTHIITKVGETIKQQTLETIGLIMAISGTTLSIIGTLYNNIALDHAGAMWIWMVSNPILLAYAYGNYRTWWDGGISMGALCVMYGIFTTSNMWGLLHV